MTIRPSTRLNVFRVSNLEPCGIHNLKGNSRYANYKTMSQTLMVKHPWPLLEISRSDFPKYDYLPTSMHVSAFSYINQKRLNFILTAIAMILARK